eukprot:CAMPEP_0206327464 /NCGR_PEP_ID=MMETSP0106_2-20121207/22161_1 /ASSEMBLY_ACC=CAM_ASM_000206 /TAXON_ID=81532 /ORGANISM="Acanthoeca-like sp., Strain 10tr" /LENGTH=44 /DNA_ID= /DNA_START= /DNA_END= /DNA_ORIENTATION=
MKRALPSRSTLDGGTPTLWFIGHSTPGQSAAVTTTSSATGPPLG